MSTSKPKAPRFDQRKPASEKSARAKRKTPSKNTRAEMLLRRTLWQSGVRYRLHAADLPGKPDLVFRGRRVAVFVDGDFWHGRDWDHQQDRLQQRSNGNYWVAKIEYNRERDRCNTKLLEDKAWRVLRFWETDILADPVAIADAVMVAIGGDNGT